MRGGGHEDRAEPSAGRYGRGNGPARRYGRGVEDARGPHRQRWPGRPVGRLRQSGGVTVFLLLGNRLPGALCRGIASSGIASPGVARAICIASPGIASPGVVARAICPAGAVRVRAAVRVLVRVTIRVAVRFRTTLCLRPILRLRFV